MKTATGKPRLSLWARYGTRLAWLLTIVLSLPALRVGFLGDDFFQHLALETGPAKYHLGPASLYDFTGAAPMHQLVAHGDFPWQTHPLLALRFFRPLSSLSIALDQALFGRVALPSHIVSVAWFIALVAVAIALLQRLLSPKQAGIAAVLYAVAGAHTVNVAWVASRHLLIVGVFAGLSIWLHLASHAPGNNQRIVRRWAASIALLLAMASSEASLCAIAFIISYELLGSSEPPRNRLVAATPAAGLGVVYVVFYDVFGFGSKHSGLYCSPASQPLAFAKASAERIPVFLGDLVGGIPSMASAIPAARPFLLILGLLFALLLVALLFSAPFTNMERRNVRWIALATVGSTIPLVGGSPDGRILVIPMFGSVALLAAAIDANWNAPKSRFWRRIVRVALCGLLLLHFGIGGLMRVGLTEAIARVGEAQKKLATTVDTTACEPGDTGLILTGSDPSLSLYGKASIAFYQPEQLRRTPNLYVLALAPHNLRLESNGPRSFTLTVEGLPRRTQPFEELLSDEPYYAGRVTKFGELTAEVLKVDAGLPTQIRFDVPARSCLLFLERRRLVSRPLLPSGQTIAIPYEKGPMGL